VVAGANERTVNKDIVQTILEIDDFERFDTLLNQLDEIITE
jgi:hypothetical protein